MICQCTQWTCHSGMNTARQRCLLRDISPKSHFSVLFTAIGISLVAESHPMIVNTWKFSLYLFLHHHGVGITITVFGFAKPVQLTVILARKVAFSPNCAIHTGSSFSYVRHNPKDIAGNSWTNSLKDQSHCATQWFPNMFPGHCQGESIPAAIASNLVLYIAVLFHWWEAGSHT